MGDIPFQGTNPVSITSVLLHEDSPPKLNHNNFDSLNLCVS